MKRSGFNLRENQTLCRNLHTCGISMGYGTADEPEVSDSYDGLPATKIVFGCELQAGYLNYPASIWDTAKSGMGWQKTAT